MQQFHLCFTPKSKSVYTIMMKEFNSITPFLVVYVNGDIK